MSPVSFRVRNLAAVACFVALPAFSAPTIGPMRAFVNYEVGQIQDGVNNENIEVERELISHATVWMLQEATLTEHARVRYGVGGAYFFVLPRNIGDNPYSHGKRSAFGITEAHGEFDILESGDDMLLQLKAGVFGYKYNPDAKNLGEYMFRTWTYPNVITTGGLEYINSAGSQLTGASAKSKVGGLSNELLLTIETDRPPVFGLSLTDIVSYNFGGIFELGAGFMFNNFYNPNPDQVTPKDPDNSYVTLVSGRQLSYDRYQYEQTSGHPDYNPLDTVVASDYYTFAGEKLMVRASASLGKLLGAPFAPHELKIYGEAIVLGLKNYPTYYEKLSDRIVYMAGANLPTFGLLDMLSVELEFAKNPFENSMEGPLGQGVVVPFVPDWGSYEKFDKDDMKWTVYARKNVYEGFSLNLQVANDHIRMLDQFNLWDFREYMSQKKSWYWAFKLGYAL